MDRVACPPHRQAAGAAQGGKFETQNIAPDDAIAPALCALLKEILQHGRLSPVFQPIVDMSSGVLVGYEGLIRGPQGSALHSPAELFKLARECGLSRELEIRCRVAVLARFAELGLPGKIFLNIS